MSARQKKRGYCRKEQAPFWGCGAGSPRMLARVQIPLAGINWLCEPCLKKWIAAQWKPRLRRSSEIESEQQKGIKNKGEP